MYGQDREAEYIRLANKYSYCIPNDEALQQPISNLKGVIDITYYRDKKNAAKGKLDFRTGILTLGEDSFIWDKQKTIY